MEGLIFSAVLSWIVFSIWMAVIWPDLRAGYRVFFGVMLCAGGFLIQIAGAVVTLGVVLVFEDLLRSWQVFEGAIVISLSAVIALSYYAVWRYLRRERVNAAGRR